MWLFESIYTSIRETNLESGVRGQQEVRVHTGKKKTGVQGPSAMLEAHNESFPVRNKKHKRNESEL